MRISIIISVAITGLSAGLWLFQPEDPNRRNPINRENMPLTDVLPPDKGITLALVDKGTAEMPHVVLVTAVGKKIISGIDLIAGAFTSETDFFTVLDSVGFDNLDELATDAAQGRSQFSLVEYTYQDLLPAAGVASRHVATGTNFPEHQQETNTQSVFNFPKFGLPTPPVTTVPVTVYELLDYEVEIYTRFDRDIKTVEDFDHAQKGFFYVGTLVTELS